ncbi:MAG: hypothetical protein MR902_03600 [Campylobacter sp.]|nr:hypothetical protein [Campylobacter sp.]
MKNRILDKIDEYFLGKAPKEIKMYIGLGGLVCAGLMYLAFSAQSQDYFETSQSNLNNITQKLNETNTYLSDPKISGPNGDDMEFGINQKKQALNSAKISLEEHIDANRYFDGKLAEVSSVTYNEKNWAKFLDMLTTIAQRENIKVFAIKSETKVPEIGKVQQVLNSRVQIAGNFANMLRYINGIEESNMVVDINGLDLNSTDGELFGTIDLTLWGIRYGYNSGNASVSSVN